MQENLNLSEVAEAVVADGSVPAAVETKQPKSPKHVGKKSWKKDFQENWIIYVMFLVPAVFLILFSYAPMFGLLMAFEDYNALDGVFGSPWVGFAKFGELFVMKEFWRAFRNTIGMAALNLIFGFVCPLVFALLISEVRAHKFKRAVQTIAIMPYFISTVIVCSLAEFFFEDMLNNAQVPVFWILNTILEVWVKTGYSSMIFIAAISSVDGELHEAACLDGANRWQRLIHITLPGILPLTLTMLTMNVGMVFMQGFDKVLLLYKPATYESADCLSTFTYRYGFTGFPDYSLATATGLFQSIIATALLLFSNWLNKRVTKSSLI